MNLWHDIEPGTADSMNVIVEINKGSKNKYEIDKKTGLIALDRVLHSAQDYPFDYGFVPQTLWHDGDALDVVILSTYPLVPGILVRSRPVAVITMVDGGERDEKIIAVPIDDPRWNTVQDLNDINPHTLIEIKHFFVTYKNIQEKLVEIHGVKDKTEAQKCFVESLDIYNKKFPKA